MFYELMDQDLLVHQHEVDYRYLNKSKCQGIYSSDTSSNLIWWVQKSFLKNIVSLTIVRI
jgi:hypothetical protein